MSIVPASDSPAATPDAFDTRKDERPMLLQRVERFLSGLDARLGFPLFILINGALFLRPMDALPRLAGWPIYEVLICSGLIISSRRVIRQFRPDALVEQPITACVLGLWLMVVLSHLSHLRISAAMVSGIEFSKLVAYYLLLVGIIDTPSRLQWFLRWLAIFACTHIGLAVIQHYGVIDLPAMRPVEEMTLAREKGEIITKYRICGAGIFHDTNDLAVLISITTLLCVYHMTDQAGRKAAWRWIVPAAWFCGILLCVHALMLTQSRGGLLAMLAGLGIFFFLRYGWKSLALAVLAPLLRMLFVGRQTDLRMLSRTTAQMRLAYWEDGLSLFAHSPVFGIGQGNFMKVIGNVAHNSFVHCFTELGFLGGTFFLGAFVLAFLPLYRLRFRSDDDEGTFAELRRLRPYFLGIVVAWTVGMFSLSRSYVTPTYMIPGLAAVYLMMLTKQDPAQRPRVSLRLALRLAGFSVACLAVVYGFVMVFRRG